MENEIKENKTSLLLSIIVVGLFIFSGILYGFNAKPPKILTLSEMVLPPVGVVLPVILGNLGTQMTETGVIDRDKFLALYASNPGLKQEAEKLLSENQTEPTIITPQNAPVLLNYFWALGLGNKNEILEQGEMMDPRYGGAGNFASTGGWTIAKGDAMDHYSMHKFITLTKEQQELVERVSKNIYRPCCGNSVYFPDCNHGMAMLGFLELMASQSATESEMYKSALILNSYWFSDTYRTIAEYIKQKKGIDWSDVDPKEVLGMDYSSGQGFQKIAAQVVLPKEKQSGGSCGV